MEIPNPKPRKAGATVNQCGKGKTWAARLEAECPPDEGPGTKTPRFPIWKTGARNAAVAEGSVTVMFGLVGAIDGDADVFRLIRAKLGQFDADLFKMQPRDLFVQMLG